MERTSLNLSAFREPRGVMRILQLIFAIFAFSTTTGFSGTVSIKAQCPSAQPAEGTINYGYPFALDDAGVTISCPPPTPGTAPPKPFEVRLNGNVSSDAEFFVATGILSLLYCLAIIGVYAFFEELYKSNAKFPMIDFLMTCILALLWISSSAAWANGLTYVKTVTDSATVQKMCMSKGGQPCNAVASSYSTLNISIMLGFLNFFLWASDLWFLYKETPWFDNRQAGSGPA